MRPTLFGLLAVAAGGLWFMAACERGEPAGGASQSTTAAVPSTQPSEEAAASVRDLVRQSGPRSAADLPPGHPAVGGTPSTLPAGHGAVPGAPPFGLKYTAPESWPREPVRSPALRVDQYRLPRAGSDTEDADLAVFAGGIGGSVEDNVGRWRAQFTTEAGQPVPDEALVRETFEVSGLKITLVDVAGRYSPGAMLPGASAPAPKENYRMLGAIVETPDGPWFFKALGPAATLGAHRAAFVEFLRSMRPE